MHFLVRVPGPGILETTPAGPGPGVNIYKMLGASCSFAANSFCSSIDISFKIKANKRLSVNFINDKTYGILFKK